MAHNLFCAILLLLLLGVFVCDASPSCTPSTFGAGIKVYDCSNLGLTEIPSGIPTDTNILYLGQNSLTTIPSGVFASLTALIELHLDSDQISIIEPGAWSGLSALTYMDLTQNDAIQTCVPYTDELPESATIDYGGFNSQPAWTAACPTTTTTVATTTVTTTVTTHQQHEDSDCDSPKHRHKHASKSHRVRAHGHGKRHEKTHHHSP